jgi:ureidoglycolate hydrolase
VEEMTEKVFSEFGSILNPDDCGKPLGSGPGIAYYADKLPLTFSCSSLITLNFLKLEKRPFEVDSTEAHDCTEELIGGFNEDIVLHVGPADKDPDFSKFRAFILPKNYWCRYKKGVWHGGPFAIKDGITSLGWVLLPPFTYANDARNVFISPALKIEL